MVLTALQEETEAIMRAMKSEPLSSDSPEFMACYRLFAGDRIDGGRGRGVLAQIAGIGRVGAAVAAKEAIGRWRPSLVLIVGTAGGLRNGDVALGDVVVATHILDYEAQRLDDGPTIRWADYAAETKLVELAKAITLPDVMGRRPEVHFGPVLSGDKVVASSTAAATFRGWRRDALAVEMEGAGVAYVSAQHKVACLMIRGVVDYADEKKREDAKSWSRAACDSVALFVQTLLGRWADEANERAALP